MDIPFMQQKIANLRQSFLDEGILNDHFITVEQVGENDSRDVLQKIINKYFIKSSKYINNIEELLKGIPLDVAKLGRYIYKFKGASASVGANKVEIEATIMDERLKEGNMEGCRAAFMRLKEEYDAFKTKLGLYLETCKELNMMRKRAGSSTKI